MSQILEAIEKAERTRRQGQQQPATDNLYRHLGKAKRKKKLSLLIPLLLILVICLTIFAYLTIVKSPAQSIAVSNNKPASQQTSTKLVSTQATKITEPDQSISAPNKAAAVAVATSNNNAATKPPKSTRQPPPVTLTPVSNKAPLAALTPVKKPLPQKETIAAQKETAPVVTTKTGDAAAAQTSNKSKAKEKKAISPANNVTAKTTSQLIKAKAWEKSLNISAIVYHDNPTKRFVLIAGAKIYAGNDIPDTNYHLVSILRQGIIVNNGKTDLMISMH